MPIYITATVFAAAFCFFMLVYLLIFGERIKLTRHVDEVLGPPKPVTIRQKELSVPLYKRTLKPLLEKMAGFFSRFLPTEKEAALAYRITLAGRPGGLGPREFTALKYILSMGTIALLGLVSSVLPIPPAQGLLIICTGVVLAWYVPELYLKQKVRERQDDVQRQLPDVLDLLTVSVEAGMGFDGAVLKVVEKTKGVLAEEFYQVLNEIKMGKPRREALRDMADRVNVDDLSTFVGSVILADQLGLSIGNVLRLQAEQMRRKRRQRAEEQAMKAPVKMLLPMVMFIFPTIFVVLLGPAVIRIMQTFSK